MTEENTTKQLLITFSGNQKDWEVFKTKFLSLASKKGYEELLTGEEKVPETTYDATTGKKVAFTDKDDLDTIALSKTAFSDLLLAMNAKHPLGKVAFDIVKANKIAKSKYPQGDVCAAWAALDKAYCRTGATKQFGLGEQWDEFSMSKNEHPISVLARLTSLQSELKEVGTPKSSSDFYQKICRVLPAALYADEIKDLKRSLRKGQTIDLADLQEALVEVWDTREKKKSSRQSDPTEEVDQALVATETNQKKKNNKSAPTKEAEPVANPSSPEPGP